MKSVLVGLLLCLKMSVASVVPDSNTIMGTIIMFNEKYARIELKSGAKTIVKREHLDNAIYREGDFVIIKISDEDLAELVDEIRDKSVYEIFK